MIHLNTIDLKHVHNIGTFPFNLPIIDDWEPLPFKNPVTFFVGENGSGKSTLMATIACAIGSITVGSESAKTDPTLKDIRRLSKKMRLSLNIPTHRGFFLRAEDFFGYIKNSQLRSCPLERNSLGCA